MTTLFQETRDAITTGQHAVIKSSLEATAKLTQAANNELLVMLAKQTGELAERASASNLLSKTRAIVTNLANNENTATRSAGMFGRPSFSDIERSGVQVSSKPDVQETPSVAPAA